MAPTQAQADDVILSVQEDDFEPRIETLADFLAICPYDVEDNERAAALGVGEQFKIEDASARAPIWTIRRVR